MVKLQLHTGCRPGEAMAMKRGEIVRADGGWEYRPSRHKGTWRGKGRVISLGPKTMGVLQPFLSIGADQYVFSPRRTVEELHERLAAKRTTKRTPSQIARAQNRKPCPLRPPAERYTRQSYRVAVVRACDGAGVPHWSPLQSRHTAATEIRKRFGLEAAQVILGHSRADVTQIYAERDVNKAREIMAEIE